MLLDELDKDKLEKLEKFKVSVLRKLLACPETEKPYQNPVVNEEGTTQEGKPGDSYPNLAIKSLIEIIQETPALQFILDDTKPVSSFGTKLNHNKETLAIEEILCKHFQCAISRFSIVFPIVTPKGQAYDVSSLLMCFVTKNVTSIIDPLGNSPLSLADLRFNYLLQHIFVVLMQGSETLKEEMNAQLQALNNFGIEIQNNIAKKAITQEVGDQCRKVLKACTSPLLLRQQYKFLCALVSPDADLKQLVAKFPSERKEALLGFLWPFEDIIPAAIYQEIQQMIFDSVLKKETRENTCFLVIQELLERRNIKVISEILADNRASKLLITQRNNLNNSILTLLVRANLFDIIASLLKNNKITQDDFKEAIQRDSQLLNAPNAAGLMPLRVAHDRGNKELIELLLSANVTDIEPGKSYLHFLIENGNIDIERLPPAIFTQISLSNAQGETPFLLAIKKGNTSLAQKLLERGSDLLAKTKEGENCLHLALPHPDIFDWLLKNQKLRENNMLSSLLNSSNGKKETPLMKAILSENLDQTKRLLKEKSADTPYDLVGCTLTNKRGDILTHLLSIKEIGNTFIKYTNEFYSLLVYSIRENNLGVVKQLFSKLTCTISFEDLYNLLDSNKLKKGNEKIFTFIMLYIIKKYPQSVNDKLLSFWKRSWPPSEEYARIFLELCAPYWDSKVLQDSYNEESNYAENSTFIPRKERKNFKTGALYKYSIVHDNSLQTQIEHFEQIDKRLAQEENQSLYYASYSKITIQALKRFSDEELRRTDFADRTYLHHAAIKGHISHVIYLLLRNFDLETKDIADNTPGDLAKQYQREQTAKLLEGATLAKKQRIDITQILSIQPESIKDLLGKCPKYKAPVSFPRAFSRTKPSVYMLRIKANESILNNLQGQSLLALQLLCAELLLAAVYGKREENNVQGIMFINRFIKTIDDSKNQVGAQEQKTPTFS